ncbi:MAG: glycosyltransferase family 4 protein [Pseudomonadota bacterium]
MKIVMVVSDFPKVTETFSMMNARHFMDQGHDVEVFHIKPFREGEIVHDFARPVVETGFSFPWIGGASAAALIRHPAALARHSARVALAFARKPKHIAASMALAPKALALGEYCKREGVDHIHAEFAGYPATAAMLASEVSGTSFSFSSHAHDIFITQGLLAEKSKKARFVRTISDFNHRFLSALPGFAAEKIRVIRCGIDPSRAVSAGKADANRPLRVLFVGSLYPRKGVHHLIAALAQLDVELPWEARIVGGGPLFENLQAQVPDPIGDRVTFAGPQKAEDVRAAYDWADVVVSPSTTGEEGRSEGIPVVLMEAMAHGCAVITSRLSGIPELVRHDETGLLTEPGDEAAIRAALQRLAKDRATARRLGGAGRTLVLSEYNIEQNAAELLAAIIESA